jgi:hypothetical protein
MASIPWVDDMHTRMKDDALTAGITQLLETTILGARLPENYSPPNGGLVGSDDDSLGVTVGDCLGLCARQSVH